MEPFNISCVTCQARLSVNDESLLGQIVACPRCGSMVEVQQPILSQDTPEPQTEVKQEPTTSEPIASETVVMPTASGGSFALKAAAVASVLIGVVTLGVVLLGSNKQQEEYFAPEVAADTGNDAIGSAPLETVHPEKAPAEKMPPEATSVHDSASEALPEEESSLPAGDELHEGHALTEVPSPGKGDVSPTPPDEPNIATAERQEKPKTPPPSGKFNPLVFDPENLDLTTLDQDTSSQSGLPQTDVLEADPQTEQQAMQPVATQVVRRFPNTEIAQSPVDVPERLQRRLPAIYFKSMSLGNFLQVLAQMGDVPISVSPDQLLMSGITLRQQVSLNVADLSLAEMLSQVLEPLKLEYGIHDGQVIVLRREAAKERDIKYPIGDLVDSTTSAEQLTEWAKQFVDPKSWQAAGGSGSIETKTSSLHVTQSQQVHYQLLVFLDRWRLTRELPPLSRFPVERLVAVSPWLAVQDRMGAPVTFTFSQYASLREIFAYWQQELDLPILVDWPALAGSQLGPNTRIACAIKREPWHQALDKILSSLGLGWRAVPGQMIEITTAGKIETELKLDLFALEGEADETVQKISQFVQQQGSAAMVHDQTGNVLITLQPALTQRKILKYLQEHKALRVD